MGRGIGWFGVVFNLLVLVMGCSGPKPTVEEEKALVAFQAVQQSLEGSPSLETLNRLLGQTESELNRLKQNPRTQPCLVNALSKCSASYQIIRKALDQKQRPLDEKRREEIDMALTFTTAFAAISIKQATDCYNQ
jgi:hypothetical protein